MIRMISMPMSRMPRRRSACSMSWPRLITGGLAPEKSRKLPRMAKHLNKVMIIGRLGKDPQMRYTPGGSPVTTFSVEAGRQWKDGNGDAREETEWFNVVTWN